MEPIKLPFFRCHKRVQAVKIKEVSLHDPTGSEPPLAVAGGFIIHDLPGVGPIAFDAAFWEKHKPQAGSYYVVYEDGYKSVSPAIPFEDGYLEEAQGIGFGEAILALKAGKRVRRSGWIGKGLFVFMQVPAVIDPEIIPRMQSLPDSVKADFAMRGEAICYSNQLALVKPNNEINGWAPSTPDALATDWEILD